MIGMPPTMNGVDREGTLSVEFELRAPAPRRHRRGRPQRIEGRGLKELCGGRERC